MSLLFEITACKYAISITRLNIFQYMRCLVWEADSLLKCNAIRDPIVSVEKYVIERMEINLVMMMIWSSTMYLPLIICFAQFDTNLHDHK